jgi:hypothetical protein
MKCYLITILKHADQMKINFPHVIKNKLGIHLYHGSFFGCSTIYFIICLGDSLVSPWKKLGNWQNTKKQVIFLSMLYIQHFTWNSLYSCMAFV